MQFSGSKTDAIAIRWTSFSQHLNACTKTWQLLGDSEPPPGPLFHPSPVSPRPWQDLSRDVVVNVGVVSHVRTNRQAKRVS